MHILYIHQYFSPPGGSGNNRSLEFAENWVKAGHQVTILTSSANFPDIQKENLLLINGIHVWVLPVGYSHFWGFWKRITSFIQFYRLALRKGMKITDVDIIYASSTPLTVGEAGRKLAKKLKVPFLFETVDLWPEVPVEMGIVCNPFLIRWLFKRTDKIYKEAAHIIALSEGMKEKMIARNIPEVKITVVHNGTNPSVFTFNQREPKIPVSVLYAGTIGKANGLSFLVNAASLIEKEFHRRDIRFRIIGNGNDLKNVKKLADELQVKNISFEESLPKEKMPEIFSLADIAVVCFAPFPILETNSANKFFDYLASGLPVVINYEGWQAEYLQKYHCGLSSAQKDVKAFAQNILRLADDFELRKEMGKKGRELAEREFDRGMLAGKVLEIIRTHVIIFQH